MAKGAKLPKKEKVFWGHCSLCGNVIPDKSIFPLLTSKEEEGGTFYGECGLCKSSHVMTVFRNSAGVITVLSMITDLTKGDLSRLHELSPISSDEILEVHEWFKKRAK